MTLFNEAVIDTPVACKDQKLLRMFGVRVCGWTPGNEDDPLTAVHLTLWNLNQRIEPTFEMDSREKVDQLIKILGEFRDRVFPPPENS